MNILNLLLLFCRNRSKWISSRSPHGC